MVTTSSQTALSFTSPVRPGSARVDSARDRAVVLIDDPRRPWAVDTQSPHQAQRPLDGRARRVRGVAHRRPRALDRVVIILGAVSCFSAVRPCPGCRQPAPGPISRADGAGPGTFAGWSRSWIWPRRIARCTVLLAGGRVPRVLSGLRRHDAQIGYPRPPMSPPTWRGSLADWHASGHGFDATCDRSVATRRSSGRAQLSFAADELDASVLAFASSAKSRPDLQA